jgi:hypothetical protein
LLSKIKKGRTGRKVVEGLESRTLFSVFTVSDVADTGPGTLRQAMTDANATAGLDTINFAIAGTGAQTISPLTVLPALTDTAGTIIDGRTQAGFALGSPTIVIDGSVITGAATGIRIESGLSTIAGLTITNFAGSQVETDGVVGGNVIIANNLIGNASESIGISIGAPDDRVGGPLAADRNIISGNGSVGIEVARNNRTVAGIAIQNNRIGTNAAGAVAQPNESGIQIYSSTDSISISDNLISGNTGFGINAVFPGSVLISGNYIGVDATGATAIPNGQDGISMIDVSDLTVQNNLISGNVQSGVVMFESGGKIVGNKIGVNAAGTGAIPNGTGITIYAVSVTISGNQISGNTNSGIRIDNVGGALIQNNLIGTDAAGTGALGNGGDGVKLGHTDPPSDTEHNLIGGTTAGLGNTIAFNGGSGVLIYGYAQFNRVLGNSIFSNALLGIDLSLDIENDGRTPNEREPDVPPYSGNNLQNFPVLSQAVSATDTTMISGSLDSTVNTAFRIEFFSDTETTAASVEGRAFLGFIDVTTDAAGLATFSAPVKGALPAGRFITTTATSAGGDTSEFSDPFAVGAANPEIEVRGNNVVITDGAATSNAGNLTDFGSTALGTPVTRTFTISNTGLAALALDAGNSVTLSGAGSDQFSVTAQPSATVGKGQSTTFTIQFNPTFAGNQTATVMITSDDADEGTFTFVIGGQGNSPVLLPEIEVNGATVPIASGDTNPLLADGTDFGATAVGDTPITQTFTITNSGQQPLNISGITLGGAGAAQFAVVTQPPTSVAAGQSTTFSVRFAPTAGGPFNATVNIANNDANENPYAFAIKGRGIVVATSPPGAALVDPQPSPTAGSTTYDFIVRYTDDEGFSTNTFDGSDIVVTGPNGFSQAATFVSTSGSGTQIDATYRITAPGGTLDAADNGTYTATLVAGQVGDVDGNTAPANSPGTFAFNFVDRVSAGQVGIVNGKKTRLSFTEADNTIVTVTLTGGTGEVFKTSGGRFDLDLTATTGKVTITAKGGNGRAELNNVRVTGGLKSLVAKTADLTGTMSSTALLGAITLGSANGATISTPSPITSLKIAGTVANSHFFSGALLGTDGRFGGTGSDADTAFGGGEIRKITIGGAVTGSLFAAGFNPGDSTLLNGDGTIVGGAASRIGSVRVKGAVDQTTVFTAGAFPKRVKFGTLSILPTSDPRFDTTA